MKSGRAQFLMPVACAIYLVDSIGVGLLLPLLPFIVLQFGAAPAVVTQLVAVGILANFFASPWLGRASDLWGRKRIVQLTFLGSVLSAVGMLATWSLPGVFLFRALGGAMAGRDAVVQAIVTQAAAKNQHIQRIGWISSARGIGLALGPILGGSLAIFTSTPAAHYRLTFLLSIVLISIAGLGATYFLPGDPARPQGRAANRGRLPWRAHATYLRPMIMSAAISYPFGIVLSATAIYTHARFGWTATQTGWLLGLTAGSIAFFRMGPAQRLTARLGPPRATTLAFSSAGLGMAIIAAWVRPEGYLLGSLLLNLGYALGLVVSTAEVSKRAAEAARGAALGLNQAFITFATFASASLCGVLFEFVGPAAPYVVGVLVVLAALTLHVMPEPLALSGSDADAGTGAGRAAKG
jgi:MFS family permease